VTKTTNEQGIIELQLEAGAYQAREISAPDGYLFDADEVFDITIEQGETTTITKTNAPHCELILKKVNADDPTQTLAGASFKLERYVGESVVETQYITIDETGIFTADLTPGTWLVTETAAPVGYILDETPQEVTLELNDSKELTFTNQPTEVIILKLDAETEEPLANATFKIVDAEQNIVIEAVTTDEFGQISIKALPAGDYFAIETSAPEDYQLLTEPIAFTVGDEVEYVVIGNEKMPGDLKIIKLDSLTNGPLAGAIFNVYADEDLQELVYEGLVTGKDGTVLTENIHPGFYWIVEIEPPPGYVGMSNSVMVEILSAELTEVEFLNDYELGYEALGAIKIIKLDSENDQALAGAVFEIYSDEELTQLVAGNLVTGADGIILVEDLEPGDYWIVEAVPPAGYDKDFDDLLVEVIGDETTEVIITNDYSGGYQTATDNYNLLVMGGGLLALGVVMLVVSRRKRKAQ
ncbi:MAG: MSCRAMM family protein, partial [Christensenellales bacterium]